MHAMIERLRQRLAVEQGSIIVAVLVMMVGTIAVLTVLSSAISGMNQARVDQSRSNAFQYANAGIDHALYRIDSNDLPTLDTPATATGDYTPTALDSDGNVTRFTETLEMDGVDYRLDVAQHPLGQDTVWKVRATGRDQSDKERQAIATIEADRLFENAFFTVNEFRLTGDQNQAPVVYDSSVCPTASSTCAPIANSAARLGTNDKFTGANGATVRKLIEQWPGGFVIYGSPTPANAQGRCFDGTCHTSSPVPGTVINRPEALEVHVPDPPAGTAPCPTAAMNGGIIPPGDYLCPNVNLNGNVTVGGSADDVARIWVTNDLSASSTAVVNRHQRPRRLQFFMAADEAVPQSGTICGAEIWAVIMAPGLPIDCTGTHQPTIYGVVIADLHYGTGNHFDFHYDKSTYDSFNTGRYHVRNWRECPPGTTDC